MNKTWLVVFLILGCSQPKDIYDICRKGTVLELQALHEKSPNQINTPNNNGYSPLVLACYYNNKDVVSFLLQNGADVDFNSSFGTPLMAAVVKNHQDIVVQLLQKNATVNLSDESGTTALHYATMFRNTNTIQMLLEAGANIHSVDAQNYSPLDYAVMFNDTKLMTLLNTSL
jgi:ankyrin repeat protein